MKDFNVGYSPERINPGDRTRLFQILLRVSGDNKNTMNKVAKLYSSIIIRKFIKSSIKGRNVKSISTKRFKHSSHK